MGKIKLSNTQKEVVRTGLKSPLRYPGGKSRAVKELTQSLPRYRLGQSTSD
jgi:hypothetical protein